MGANPAGTRRLTRSQRLHYTREFAQIREEGQRLVQGSLIANWMPRTKGECSRLGIVVSRKVGNAVRRSRARRLIREVFRRHQRGMLTSVDLVLIARNSIVNKGYAGVENDFLRLLQRASLIAS